MTLSNSTEFIALVPAGGTGTRVGGDKPKQYLPIFGQPMLVLTIRALLVCEWIQHVYVVVSELDPYKMSLQELTGPRCSLLPVGGATRRDSVLAGLEAIAATPAGFRGPSPWVMVHDAARPGISKALLEQLRDCVLSQKELGEGGDEGNGSPHDAKKPFGALLALPVADTIKREADSAGSRYASVAHTVDRTGLWAAQTPQVFPMDLLKRALAEHQDATDEASAIERMGRSPALVPGHWHNMKVTTAEDLAMMQQVFEIRNARQDSLFSKPSNDE